MRPSRLNQPARGSTVQNARRMIARPPVRAISTSGEAPAEPPVRQRQEVDKVPLQHLLGKCREHATQRDPTAQHDEPIPLAQGDRAQARRRHKGRQRSPAAHALENIKRRVLALRVRIRRRALLLILLGRVAHDVDPSPRDGCQGHAALGISVDPDVGIVAGEGRGEAELVVHPEPAARRDALPGKPEPLHLGRSRRRSGGRPIVARIALACVRSKATAIEDRVGGQVGVGPSLFPRDATSRVARIAPAPRARRPRGSRHVGQRRAHRGRHSPTFEHAHTVPLKPRAAVADRAAVVAEAPQPQLAQLQPQPQPQPPRVSEARQQPSARVAWIESALLPGRTHRQCHTPGAEVLSELSSELDAGEAATDDESRRRVRHHGRDLLLEAPAARDDRAVDREPIVRHRVELAAGGQDHVVARVVDSRLRGSLRVRHCQP